MPVWAIADLHLSFGVPNKEMDIFGPQWASHARKIEHNWKSHIHAEDLVLIPGDISWAMNPEEAKADLEWIHNLPGTKVMLRGNHDYWWTSLSKVEKVLPSSIHLIQNNAFRWNDIGIGGTRLWDTSEYNFREFVDFQDNPRARKLHEQEGSLEETERIFARELLRLESSLKAIDKSCSTKIVMTHYPPIDAFLHDSRTSALLEKYKVDICVFGHLHNLKQGVKMFGTKNGIRYLLTACDYLNFEPVQVTS